MEFGICGCRVPRHNLPRLPRREDRAFSGLLLLPLPWTLSQVPSPNSWPASVHSFSARLPWPWCQKSQPAPTHMPNSTPELLGCCIFVSRTSCHVCQCYMSAAQINSNCYEYNLLSVPQAWPTNSWLPRFLYLILAKKLRSNFSKHLMNSKS